MDVKKSSLTVPPMIQYDDQVVRGVLFDLHINKFSLLSMLDGGWGKRDGGHLSKFGAALVNEGGRPDHRAGASVQGFVGRKVGYEILRERRKRAG